MKRCSRWCSGSPRSRFRLQIAAHRTALRRTTETQTSHFAHKYPCFSFKICQSAREKFDSCLFSASSLSSRVNTSQHYLTWNGRNRLQTSKPRGNKKKTNKIRFLHDYSLVLTEDVSYLASHALIRDEYAREERRRAARTDGFCQVKRVEGATERGGEWKTSVIRGMGRFICVGSRFMWCGLSHQAVWAQPHLNSRLYAQRSPKFKMGFYRAH